MADPLATFFRSSRIALWVVLVVLLLSVVYSAAMSVLNWGAISL